MRHVSLQTAGLSAAVFLAVLLAGTATTHARPTAPVNPSAAPTPMPAAPAAVARRTSVEEIEITTRDRQTISGTLTVPSSRSKVPAALLVHAPGSDRKSLEGLGERLAKQGFAVLAIDLRGHGASTSEAFNWSTCQSDEDRGNLWALALKDLEAAADTLSSDSRVHSTSLAVIGHEAGCALAARHALRNENVRAIALIEPGDQTYGFDLGTDLEELSGLPTMIIVGPEEREAGMSLAQRSAGSDESSEYVELTVMRKPTVLEDKRLPAQLSKWLDGHAGPKRGR